VIKGDGIIITPLEACDDSNTNSNDGCSNGTVDIGYSCTG